MKDLVPPAVQSTPQMLNGSRRAAAIGERDSRIRAELLARQLCKAGADVDLRAAPHAGLTPANCLCRDAYSAAFRADVADWIWEDLELLIAAARSGISELWRLA
jgi:hypothetical protein